MLADPPDASAAAKAVPLIVIILMSSDDSTVAIAFPAYIGRMKVFSDSMAVISEIC